MNAGRVSHSQSFAMPFRRRAVLNTSTEELRASPTSASGTYTSGTLLEPENYIDLTECVSGSLARPSTGTSAACSTDVSISSTTSPARVSLAASRSIGRGTGSSSLLDSSSGPSLRSPETQPLPPRPRPQPPTAIESKLLSASLIVSSTRPPALPPRRRERTASLCSTSAGEKASVNLIDLDFDPLDTYDHLPPHRSNSKVGANGELNQSSNNKLLSSISLLDGLLAPSFSLHGGIDFGEPPNPLVKSSSEMKSTAPIPVAKSRLRSGSLSEKDELALLLSPLSPSSIGSSSVFLSPADSSAALLAKRASDPLESLLSLSAIVPKSGSDSEKENRGVIGGGGNGSDTYLNMDFLRAPPRTGRVEIDYINLSSSSPPPLPPKLNRFARGTQQLPPQLQPHPHLYQTQLLQHLVVPSSLSVPISTVVISKEVVLPRRTPRPERTPDTDSIASATSGELTDSFIRGADVGASERERSSSALHSLAVEPLRVALVDAKRAPTPTDLQVQVPEPSSASDKLKIDQMNPQDTTQAQAAEPETSARIDSAVHLSAHVHTAPAAAVALPKSELHNVSALKLEAAAEEESKKRASSADRQGTRRGSQSSGCYIIKVTEAVKEVAADSSSGSRVHKTLRYLDLDWSEYVSFIDTPQKAALQFIYCR